MVHIKPFQGLRYQQAAGNMDTLTAPPYDVISPEHQAELHDLNPYNIVRLILGYKVADEPETDNVYTRAHQTLESWREQGILKEDSREAIYAYTQTWEGVERRGFIASMLLESYESGQILPHEYTLGGPKADRLALTKATGTILSPIFCLYHDPEKQIEKTVFESQTPVENIVDVTDKDGVRHRFWPIQDESVLHQIQTTLGDKPALIADGHHRFETALAHQAWRRTRDGQEHAPHGSLPWDYTMAFFSNMADPGLKVYPTHRVLKSLPDGKTPQDVQDILDRYFIEATDSEAPLFWVQISGTQKTGLVLKPGIDLSSIQEPLRALDVAILDSLVFQAGLNQSADALKQAGHLVFIRDEEEVETLLSSSNTIVFWVHAPSVETVRIICESGHRMPQKSTYFYPKLLSGLVLYYYGPDAQSY